MARKTIASLEVDVARYKEAYERMQARVRDVEDRAYKAEHESNRLKGDLERSSREVQRLERRLAEFEGKESAHREIISDLLERANVSPDN